MARAESGTSEERSVSLRINTNVQAFNALRNLSGTVSQMGTSMTRLSTGLRINTAADDPAGLIISEGLRSQIKGLDQALRNSQDAINMTKTAEAALDEVQRLLRDLRALTVHSANTAVVDSTQLEANQAQVRASLQSINRIAEQTQWGKKKLLDGTAGALANVTSITNVNSIYIGGTFAGESVKNGPITMVRTVQAERALVTLGKSFANTGAIIATVGSFVVNGYSFTSDGTESLQTILDKVNTMSSTTGVTATFSGGNVVLQSDFGSQFNVNFFDPSGILHSSSSATDTGVDAQFDVTVDTSAGPQTVTFVGGRGPKESGLRLTDNDGNSIIVTELANNNLTSAAQVGHITAGDVRFQVGANANQSVSFSMPAIFANRLGTRAVPGKTLQDLNLTTITGANDAMKIVDDAIDQLAQWRGEIGSFQANYLDSNVRSLGVARENMAASESQIRDADMAVEMTDYTRLQILQQSGMAMLAQANRAPQTVLQLLQGG